MSTAVPAVDRASSILDWMAAAPGRQFTAAELSRDVGIHRATCFSLLQCLTEHGLIRRSEESKTYSLGSGLLNLGSAAAHRFVGIDEARREMFGLARDLDVGGLICAPDGSTMVLIDRVGAELSGLAVPHPRVTAVPLAPPIGAVFVAWSPAGVVEEWLGRAPVESSPADLESYARSVAAVRIRGFSIGSEEEVERQLEQVLSRLGTAEGGDRLAAALELADLVRTGVGGDWARPPGAAIDHLIGPIFDSRGQVAMTLTIFGRPGQMMTDSVGTYSNPLLEACRRVTASIGGQWALSAQMLRG